MGPSLPNRPCVLSSPGAGRTVGKNPPQGTFVDLHLWTAFMLWTLCLICGTVAAWWTMCVCLERKVSMMHSTANSLDHVIGIGECSILIFCTDYLYWKPVLQCNDHRFRSKIIFQSFQKNGIFLVMYYKDCIYRKSLWKYLAWFNFCPCSKSSTAECR